MKPLQYVDALRGLAILMVLVVHTITAKPNLPQAAKDAIAKGAMGVQLFYVASAFTLFLSFRHRAGRERSPVRNFYLRRLFRIAPMYWLGIAYYLWQDGLGPRRWLGDAPGISAGNIAANITFTHGFNPYWINSLVPGGWSIGIEMTFYALLPLLFARVRTLRQAFDLFLLSLLFKVACDALFLRYPLIAHERLWMEYLFFYFPSQLPIFCLGIILFFVVSDGAGLAELRPASLLAFIGLLLAELIAGGGRLIPGHLFFGFAFLLLGILLSRHPVRILVNPLVAHVGKVSFSIYLVHFAVLHAMAYLGLDTIVRNGPANFAMRYAVVLAASVAVSTVTYRLVEMPCQDLGRRLIGRLEKKA